MVWRAVVGYCCSDRVSAAVAKSTATGATLGYWLVFAIYGVAGHLVDVFALLLLGWQSRCRCAERHRINGRWGADIAPPGAGGGGQ